ncbi:MAG: iron-containing redox enzyme family protein [Myxococcales bacterium]|nr:iron-containing redox enzyme family protein [Myxococcales bacterium]
MTQSAKAFLKDLRREIESHPAVNHLFLNRLATSPFAKQDYRVFAENHYALVCIFTSYLESLLVRAPDSEAKLWLAKVLVDEYGEGSEGRDHSNLYASFLEATGGDPSAVMSENVRAPAHAFITTHQRLVRERPFLEGLGAVGPGHEWAIPKMFEAVIPGLRRAGFDETEIQYFTLHVEQDDDHGSWLEEALERYASETQAQQEIRRGAIASLEARGRFWEGVQREVIRYRQPRAPRPDGPKPRALLGEVLITAWDGFEAGKQLEDRVRGWWAERRPTLAGLRQLTRQL